MTIAYNSNMLIDMNLLKTNGYIFRYRFCSWLLRTTNFMGLENQHVFRGIRNIENMICQTLHMFFKPSIDQSWSLCVSSLCGNWEQFDDVFLPRQDCFCNTMRSTYYRRICQSWDPWVIRYPTHLFFDPSRGGVAVGHEKAKCNAKHL